MGWAHLGYGCPFTTIGYIGNIRVVIELYLWSTLVVNFLFRYGCPFPTRGYFRNFGVVLGLYLGSTLVPEGLLLLVTLSGDWVVFEEHIVC